MTVTALADVVRRWASAVRDATRQRDEAIRTMQAGGASVREIAELAGLSDSHVCAICREQQESKSDA